MSWNDRAREGGETFIETITRVGSAFLFSEILLALLVLMAALAAPRFGQAFYTRIEGSARVFGSTPARQVLTVGLLALVVRAVLLPWQGAPSPTIHDENSLLLQAQTYAAGRLANPTHPFWQHFETFHVNQIPAYASMYFPGRSAPLTAGLLLFDNAWVGAWLSFVLMCMAAVWMLQGWVPAPYALLGGLFLVIRFGVFSYWVNSYWGGAFPALGAMLVVGALPRILRQPGWRLGMVFGTGALILMTSRPYEGLLLCAPVALVLAIRFLRPTWAGGRWVLLRMALPAMLLVGSGGLLMLANNAATTGNGLLSPYSLNRLTYAEAPAFVLAEPVRSARQGPAYFREFYAAEGQDYTNRQRSLRGLLKGALGKMFHNWNFYIGPVFTAALLAGLWVSRRHVFLLGTLAFFVAGYSLETWNFPHYTAPILPVLLILLMRGFEWLRTWTWRGRPTGLFLTRAMPTAGIVVLLLPLSTLFTGVPRIAPNLFTQACCALAHNDVRSKVVAQVKATPGRDLVLVKDGPGNPLHYEMVYNEPDIDAAEIVFARRLGPERDEALLKHFAGREVWEFEWKPGLPDDSTLVRLTPAGR